MRVLVVNDFHGQFRDKKTCKMLFNFIKREKPDKIILNGDVVDFYSISRFDKDAFRQWHLQEEIDNVITLLNQLRKRTDVPMIYIEGNHEERLRKYLRSNARPLATLKALRIESLLKLKELRIKYETDGIWLGDLFVYHGSLVRKDAGATAKAEREKNGCSGMSGHTHRDGTSPIRTRGGQLCWWENFCMCDLNPDYVDGIANWTQGFSVITQTGGREYVEQIPIINGEMIYGGKLWKI